jgi:Uma2 family endonuclease
MGDAVKILPHYTYDDYVKWEGKWEVIDGIPYAMSPAPAPKHQIVAGNLHAEFRFGLKGCKSCKVYQPIDYLVENDTILQPDILVVCGDIKKNYLDFPPALVAEVLSPATAAKDRFTKYPIYQAKGIRYYLMLDPKLEEAEVYEMTDGEYKLMIKGKEIKFDFNFETCHAAIDFSEVWK